MPTYSFASASTSLPEAVTKAVSKDIVEWRQSKQSVLELPFTGDEFRDILIRTEQDLRSLLGFADHFHVLFLQGGASTQFALLPMNLLGPLERAAYVETGYWSQRAKNEARPWCRVSTAACGDGLSLPPPEDWQIAGDAAYCHYTTNESADGLQFHTMPDTGDVPLIADVTGDFLSHPIPVERYGLIYASGQKSLGAVGLTVVIIRDDLLRLARTGTPAPLDYRRQVAARSKVNTPPTLAVLIANHMLRWTLEQGGVETMACRNRRKAEMLYAMMDGDFYRCPCAVPDRSLISVRFHLPDARSEADFLQEAQANGLLHLKGHPAVGGLRAALYNTVTEDAVAALTAFMADFRSRRG